MPSAPDPPRSGLSSSSCTLHEADSAPAPAPGAGAGAAAEAGRRSDAGAGSSSLNVKAPASDPEKGAAGTEEEAGAEVAKGQDGLTWEVESKPWYHHALFIASCISGQAISQAQVGASIIPAKVYGEWLGTDAPGQWAWITASYGITLGVGVLVSGQLGDRYGAKRIFLLGMAVQIIANIGSGFASHTIAGFDTCRGLAGLGGSLVLPNAAGMLGRAFPPGHLRTISFALYGAMAPAGSMLGAVFASLVVQTIPVAWAFWLTAVVAGVFAGLAMLILPDEAPNHALPALDWLGFGLGGSALLLLCFAFSQGALVGWHTPYVCAIFVVSLVLFGAFVFWERWLGDRALVPMSVWTRQSVVVLLALWFGWMSFGIYLYYTSSFLRDIRGASTPLHVSVQMATLPPMGITAALSLIWIFPRVEGHAIFMFALFCFTCGDLFMAVTPAKQSFWAMVFPAQLIVTWGSDFSFAAGSLIIANSVPRNVQGTASGLVQVIVNYSIALGLGMAGTVETYVNEGGADELRGYRGAFYFGTGVAALGFFLVVFFVRTNSRGQSGH